MAILSIKWMERNFSIIEACADFYRISGIR